jgi:ATP-dependent DNA ligase
LSPFPKISVPLTTKTMEARSVAAFPVETGWQFEPKWDGFRALVFRSGPHVEIRGRSGKSLARYFPEVIVMMRALRIRQFVLDGELVIAQGDESSFDQLQQRLHPAKSRINKLAQESPATFVAFDCLMGANGRSLLDTPLGARRRVLESVIASFDPVTQLRLSPYTRSARVAKRWLQSTGGALDGIVAKRLDETYRCGERAMMKIKKRRTADCVVGGFRYRTGSRAVGSLLLGLYDSQGKLDHVGFTASISRAAGMLLAKKLNAKIGAPGFTGKSPGAPSRWSSGRPLSWRPLKPDLVVEVMYDQVTNDRFRHGTTLLRWRPEKKPRQCTFEQLQSEADPKKVARLLSRK